MKTDKKDIFNQSSLDIMSKFTGDELGVFLTIISPTKPIEKNWTPITINNIPRKKSGLIIVNSSFGKHDWQNQK